MARSWPNTKDQAPYLAIRRCNTSGWKPAWSFVFDGRVCRGCGLRSQCIASKNGKGRTVTLHPQEALLQQARALQHSEAFTEYRERRQVVEHRLARLVQLGVRQARYFGRPKTLFQLLMAATVANLTLVAAKMGTIGGPSGQATTPTAALGSLIAAAAKIFPIRPAKLWLHRLSAPWLVNQSTAQNRGFQPES